ncbi:hypothetical protein K505DRAFT_374576 [Melanomma pulvis-pyrius CBS 109.77]|uniref:Uncharacterized protein n=1 Tax=Melanomma pulvis-pyrius CBS 109.77 TaxID=1314802 RepID=A0A6A6XDH2_9PLEO|nr:hypothetical protein K505DRAFT_374576 [Melanomma pulvis-pyrius CBS 109.77]
MLFRPSFLALFATQILAYAIPEKVSARGFLDKLKGIANDVHDQVNDKVDELHNKIDDALAPRADIQVTPPRFTLPTRGVSQRA